MPTYPGGKAAYQKFVEENTVYPPKALADGVEGVVYLSYTVNNLGIVEEVRVEKGIGHGCDEEAARVVRMMRYEAVRNRGVRMKVEMKTKITFRLPAVAPVVAQENLQLNYTAVPAEKTNSPEPKPQTVYNYTINF